MNLLFPRIPRALLPRMLGIAASGGLTGGLYGALHDQITCGLSPEYFTKLKFAQFRWIELGLPPRGFAAVIGFVASGSAGFFAAWFLARFAVPAWPPTVAFRRCITGFAIILGFGLLGGVVGFLLAERHDNDDSAWLAINQTLAIQDLPAFVRVAYIHSAGYLGAFLGLLVALFDLARRKRNQPASHAR